jgi:hypothetical protein
MRWRGALEHATGWGPLGEVRIDGTERIGIDTLVERVGSRSFALLLEPGDRADLLEEVRALATEEADGRAWVDLPTVTVMFWRQRG